jgi:5-methyltetrahydrofolate--homocysteine methyltransferase
MQDLLARLIAGEVLVADGAMGSLLMAHGLEPGGCPEAVNVSDPDTPTEIARQYLAAGAEIIQTNTFGASPHKLALYGLADRTEEINRTAVIAVRRAVGDQAYVCGSIGPSGAILRPYGDADPADIGSGFARQIEALLAAGADILCIETMTDLAEAKLAVAAARTAAGDQVPVMATMTFDRTPRGYFTIMGVDIAAAAAGLAAAGADIVGSNCGNGMANMVEIATEFARNTDLPLLIQSNAGLPELVDGKVVYNETPDYMAAKVADLIAVGTAIIGGCCGTTPAHIAAFKQAVARRSR